MAVASGLMVRQRAALVATRQGAKASGAASASSRATAGFCASRRPATPAAASLQQRRFLADAPAAAPEASPGARASGGAGAGASGGFYAANPGAWQADPFVQMYGQLLAVRDQNLEAFLMAADTLRQALHLPADLRASVGRTRATVLFQEAVRLTEGLQVSPEVPWPEEDFEKALAAATKACKAYDAAVGESSDPALCKALATLCPEWPEAVSITAVASVEVRKLRGELRLREARWHARHAEHARAVVAAARGEGGNGDAASRACEALHAAGLPATVEEVDLWDRAAAAARKLIEECAAPEILPADANKAAAAQEALGALRSQGQVLLMMALKDSAVACAMAHELDAAVKHMLDSLAVRVETAGILTPGAAEQVQAAAQGVMKLCFREMNAAGSQSVSEAVAQHGIDLGNALSAFNAALGGNSKGGGKATEAE
eukprot:TRINITY_DN23964_c0_g5_i1.p2 TRINITY_DN23964_c0_g5~~TRINITY_DN23964_c0_g5_i1.p2  ORF type:complete len:433 (-),score=114.08 TRINITY_DN23964_c0_g5_i1:95-1393(-)